MVVQPRDQAGRFGEKTGAPPEITLADLPKGFRYERVADESTGNVVVIMHATHGTPRSDYVDMARSRIGRKEYRPEVRAAITRLKAEPGVVEVIVREDDPPFAMRVVGRPYLRRGSEVVDVTLDGEHGSFDAPIPVTQAANAASVAQYLVQHNHDAVLDKVVGVERRQQMFQAFQTGPLSDFEMHTDTC